MRCPHCGYEFDPDEEEEYPKRKFPSTTAYLPRGCG